MAGNPTLDVVLRNDTAAPQLYAHVTGTDDGGLVVLRADGRTVLRPPSPRSTMQPLGPDCAIAVGGPGSSRKLALPRISGGRIWFCTERPLAFFLNPGPSLVEPSATNPSDANYELDWAFCELTWNEQQLYANVSFVDFVGLPVSLQLRTGAGRVKTVPGMPPDGVARVCAGLEAQARLDGCSWDKLVVRRKAGGAALRALSPNAGAMLHPGLFHDYYRAYVDAVWNKYAAEDLTVNTQFTWGAVRGRVVPGSGKLAFAGVAGAAFDKPSAADIFTCSTGPFAAGPGVSPQALNIGARLAAALNRSTLLVDANQPEGERVDAYYRDRVTNHYARICHEVSVGGRGYAFPYDDVGASRGVDQSGFVNDANPRELTVAVGKPLM